MAAVTAARTRLETATAEAERLRGELQAAAERIAAAEAETRAGAAELLDAYVTYLAGLAEIRVADPDAVLARLEGWAGTAEGATRRRRPWTTPPARRRPRSAAGSPTRSRGCGPSASETSLLAEIERLESGGHDVPPVPHRAPAPARGRARRCGRSSTSPTPCPPSTGRGWRPRWRRPASSTPG